jgi:hypothetical protein
VRTRSWLCKSESLCFNPSSSKSFKSLPVMFWRNVPRDPRFEILLQCSIILSVSLLNWMKISTCLLQLVPYQRSEGIETYPIASCRKSSFWSKTPDSLANPKEQTRWFRWSVNKVSASLSFSLWIPWYKKELDSFSIWSWRGVSTNLYCRFDVVNVCQKYSEVAFGKGRCGWWRWSTLHFCVFKW